MIAAVGEPAMGELTSVSKEWSRLHFRVEIPLDSEPSFGESCLKLYSAAPLLEDRARESRPKVWVSYGHICKLEHSWLCHSVLRTFWPSAKHQ